MSIQVFIPKMLIYDSILSIISHGNTHIEWDLNGQSRNLGSFSYGQYCGLSLFSLLHMGLGPFQRLRGVDKLLHRGSNDNPRPAHLVGVGHSSELPHCPPGGLQRKSWQFPVWDKELEVPQAPF